MDEETSISELEEALSENHNLGEVPSISTINLLQSLLDNPANGAATLQFISSPFVLSSLTTAMDSGPPFLSIASSNAYLSMLLLSPSLIINFSPLPFLSLLRSLRRSIKPRVAIEESGQRERSVPKVKNKARGKSLSSSSSSADCGVYLSVLEKLEKVVSLVDLTRIPDVLKILVQTIADIPSSAVEFFMNALDYNRLTTLCSEVLLAVLCYGENDEIGETAAEVFKSLTPWVLTSVKSQARAFALGFLRRLMDENTVVRCNGVHRAAVNFPRYLARRAPEKADARGLAVEAIIGMVVGFEPQERVDFVDFAITMTRGKGNLRMLGVDLVFNLLVGEVRRSLGSQVCKACIDSLIQRCSDSNAGVRARALLNLTNLVDHSNDDNLFLVMKDDLKDVLHNCCLDEKTNVRRAALGMVNKLIGTFGKEILDPKLVKMIGMACSDPLVSTRKAAVLALSEAFRCVQEESICVEWLNSVPRLITDNESSIQEECENLFLELVLDRISNAGTSTTLCEQSMFSRTTNKRKAAEMEINGSLPDYISVLLEGICHGEVAPWVKKICTSLGKKKRLKPKLVNALQNIIMSSESRWVKRSMPPSDWTAPPGAWFLLSEVSAYLPKTVAWEFLHHNSQLHNECKISSVSVHRKDTDGTESGVGEESVAWAGNRVFLMQTIANVSVELPPEPAADLAHDLLKRIEQFTMHTAEVNAHVKALKVLCKRKTSNSDEADKLVKKWVQQVLSKATKLIDRYMSGSADAANKSSFLTPARTKSLSKVETAIYTVGSIVVSCPSADVSSIITLLHNIITSAQSDTKVRKIPEPPLPLKQYVPSLYTKSWLTMGKICLANGKLAKRYIPLFVRELEKSESAALRNNLVVMMSDFCVRYTALVDCYISKITKCLRDPCELVRRQTFILLSRLLQRDYVKWRGLLFLRFLLCLVDSSDKIRQLADFLFDNILKVKAPLLAYNSFVEAVFVLNDYNVHTGQSGHRDSKAENKLFCIKGNDDESRSKRMHIYVSLLKQMAPEHLLATFAKLCAEILAAASDGMLNLDDVSGQSVLQDAFQVLSCKEIRIQGARNSQTDGGEVEDDAKEASSATRRAITQEVRKGLIQNTIPIFIELKRLLESKNSPLIGSLMECLRILLDDFKNEIDDILVADQQLRKELVYDMQRYETAKVRLAAATAQKRGGLHSPHHGGAAEQQESVMAALIDASAAAKAKSVLKELRNGVSTPPLASMSVPKLKIDNPESGARPSSRFSDVVESLRKRQSFESDEEN